MKEDAKTPTPEEEYDAMWDEADKADADKKTDVKPEDKSVEKSDADKKAEEAEKKAESDRKAKETEEKSKDHGTLASLEKAYKDTKAAVTRVSQENAELKKTIEDLKSGKATQTDVDNARKSVDAARANLDKAKTAVYKDYPELKDLLDPVLDRLDSLQRENEEAKEQAKKDAKDREEKSKKEAEDKILDEYNTKILPEVLKAHDDFLTIIKDPEQEYFKWAEKQRPALRMAALHSMDPEDIKDAVTKFKEFKAKGAAAEDKTAEEKRKHEKQELAKSMPGGAPPAKPKGKEAENNDPDAMWEDAGKILIKQGVAR